MNWQGKKVLVTGAGGFIGSHLAERLVREGALVRALVHYNALGSRGWLDESPLGGEMEVVAGDVTDRDSVRAAVKDRERVFHLAALIAIPYSYQAPASYVKTNVEGTLNVLQACLEEGVERMVQTSTSETYGTARYVPIDEGHPLQGQSPYSASKIGADKMTEAYIASYSLPAVILRPFNTFGPRQSARAVIPTIVSQLLEGNRVRLGNLSPTRDLTYVADTVSGFLAAGGAEAAAGRTVNLGTGEEISIGDLVLLIGSLMGREVEIVSEEQRLRPKDSEVDRLLSDNSLARELLGWTPEKGLKTGLEETIAWIRANPDRFRPGIYNI